VIIWLDNHLWPALAAWITQQFGFECRQVRDLGLAQASDMQIFHAARATDCVLISKDSDFVELVQRLGRPPSLVWLTCGNTRERALRTLMQNHLQHALDALAAGDAIVEIGGGAP
jgi:predicted nuclease of predicted toxin-antitoxin system